jgi:hypothetical protein
MKAVGLSVANIAKSIVDSMPQKMSKPTATDVEKISAGLSHSDNVATRDLDSASVKACIAKAVDLEVEGSPATVTQQYQFLVKDATCYALLVLGFRTGLKVEMHSNMEFLFGHMSSARMRAKSLLLNWNVGTDAKPGLQMDKMIDRVLTFKNVCTRVYIVYTYRAVHGCRRKVNSVLCVQCELY